MKRTTSAETAARYHVAKHRLSIGGTTTAPPAYATDGIAIPRRKRRVLLDLAPATVEILLVSMQLARSSVGACDGGTAIERLLVEALEKAR